ncbi:MAG: pyroglutamyl-peptidase I, partial [Clostridia bacterium]|nr:pyroglutamyl-peptidase I [Clostridia bacterium]
MKILLTGFDPFGGEKINPSWQAVCAAAEKIDFAEVKTLLVPTEYFTSVKKAVTAIGEFSPDVVVSVGQAGGRASVSFERVAVNIIDSDSPDNTGLRLHSLNCEGGADKIFSTLPVEDMVKAVNASGLPAYVSESAGRFVCNHLFYGLL